MKRRDIRARFEFVKEDMWFGVFGPKVKNQRVHLYICVVPCFPLHISWPDPQAKPVQLVAVDTLGQVQFTGTYLPDSETVRAVLERHVYYSPVSNTWQSVSRLNTFWLDEEGLLTIEIADPVGLDTAPGEYTSWGDFMLRSKIWGKD